MPAAALPADRQPACASQGHDFPLTTRIHGGPDRYEAGGAHYTWFIDLKNTTAHPCGNIHPVVVLVDAKRVLTDTQPKLQFLDGGRLHPVTFARTDEKELVGAFDDGFPGFTVPPGQTVTVKVRLGLTADARPNDVVANAAIVQRHGGDGDWVGQSNDYRFRIEEPAGEELANTGEQTSWGLDAAIGVLLLAVGGLLVAGSPLVLRRRRR
ncbi:hypothetical protein ABT186_33700 [Streptomyces sp. NPDC001634]|uniref:hypothetical protein n=1 Tax=Streptomyces sp. NPDC001634 TaxID=3154390 RepID=UPI0033166C94